MVQVLLAMFGHVLAIVALFAMFGSVIDEFPYKMTMFDLTFGTNIGGELYYKTNTGMVFIFLFEIICIIVALISIIKTIGNLISYSDEMNGIGYYVTSCLFSLIALIMSFCSISLLEEDLDLPIHLDSVLSLGAGPIAFSVLHIFSILFIVGGILLNVYKSSRRAYYARRANYYRSVSGNAIQGTTTSVQRNNAQQVTNGAQTTSEEKRSEEEKIVLLEKYHKLLENNIITQEEFDAKKKEILKD